MPSEHLNTFPFAAVVGMDDGKRAIECALANPNIRTVLIRGGEGSAKTTLARSSGSIGSRKVVNCPLNVTDEQLFGGLDIEKTLKSGKPEMQKGLLARADGNILYIDDVNLMDRAMLSGLLDCVLTGTVKVEHQHVSFTQLSIILLGQFFIHVFHDIGRQKHVVKNNLFLVIHVFRGKVSRHLAAGRNPVVV
jgi:magnesium chelatase subunit D